MYSRNPIMPLPLYFPDGEPHFIDGELFVYPSCDVRDDDYCSDRLYVAHSKDLTEWTVDGPAFDSSEIDWDWTVSYPPGLADAHSYEELPHYLKDELSEADRKIPFEVFKADQMKKAESHSGNRYSRLLYAPDAVTFGGKSYLFFCTSDQCEGVAFADNPTGPYTNPVKITMDRSGLPISGIDPSVFRDDDGKVYLYWGQIKACGAELTEDLTMVKEDTIVRDLLTEDEHGFHEASSMRKIGDTYYMVFADMHRGRPTALGYATSKSPLGPFEYQGIIVDNIGCDPGTWNNHGGMECVNGQWYIFYHRSTGNSRYMRRMCAEPISIDENGKIGEVPVTSIGMGEPYRKGEGLCGYQVCKMSSNIYIRDDSLIIKKGEGEVVYRYLDKDNTGFSSISYDGTGNGSLSYKVNENGELTVSLKAETDMVIKSFELVYD